MILYLDSSAILSVHLQEPSRRPQVSEAINQAESSISSPIAYVEVRAGLARARYREDPPRLTANDYTRALTEFADDWTRYGQIALSAGLIQLGGELAERHRLRAYDATHLAAAIVAREQTNEEIALSTWDRELAAAASAEGLSLAHEVTT